MIITIPSYNLKGILKEILGSKELGLDYSVSAASNNIDILIEVLQFAIRESEDFEQMDKDYTLRENEGYASIKDAEESGAEIDLENKGVESLAEWAELHGARQDKETGEYSV